MATAVAKGGGCPAASGGVRRSEGSFRPVASGCIDLIAAAYPGPLFGGWIEHPEVAKVANFRIIRASGRSVIATKQPQVATSVSPCYAAVPSARDIGSCSRPSVP